MRTSPPGPGSRRRTRRSWPPWPPHWPAAWSPAAPAAARTPTAQLRPEKITLRVGDFGTFGYNAKGADLFAEYTRLHPDIKIVEDNNANEQNYWNATQTHLAAGSRRRRHPGVRRRPDGPGHHRTRRPVRGPLQGSRRLRRQLGAGQVGPGPAKDGKVIGTGHRPRPRGGLLQHQAVQGGRPADRPRRGRRAVGRAAGTSSSTPSASVPGSTHPQGTHFLDSGEGLFNSVVGSGTQQYYDADGKAVYDTNPAVKAAWKLAGKAVAAGETRRHRAVLHPVGVRLRQQHLRDHDLPRLADGQHRQRRRRQEHRACGTSPPPRRRPTGAAPT